MDNKTHEGYQFGTVSVDLDLVGQGKAIAEAILTVDHLALDIDG